MRSPVGIDQREKTRGIELLRSPRARREIIEDSRRTLRPAGMVVRRGSPDPARTSSRLLRVAISFSSVPTRDFLFRLDCGLCVFLLHVLGVLSGSNSSPQWLESAPVRRCPICMIWSARDKVAANAPISSFLVWLLSMLTGRWSLSFACRSSVSRALAPGNSRTFCGNSPARSGQVAHPIS